MKTELKPMKTNNTMKPNEANEDKIKIKDSIMETQCTSNANQWTPNDKHIKHMETTCKPNEIQWNEPKWKTNANQMKAIENHMKPNETNWK